MTEHTNDNSKPETKRESGDVMTERHRREHLARHEAELHEARTVGAAMAKEITETGAASLVASIETATKTIQRQADSQQLRVKMVPGSIPYAFELGRLRQTCGPDERPMIVATSLPTSKGKYDGRVIAIIDVSDVVSL